MASLNDLMHRFYEKFSKSGDRLPVDVGGQITVQEVNIGEVKQGARGENAEPWQVTLTGSTVDLRGLAANRPAANTVPPGTTYWSVDTGDVSVSTGTTWRRLGVA